MINAHTALTLSPSTQLHNRSRQNNSISPIFLIVTDVNEESVTFTLGKETLKDCGKSHGDGGNVRFSQLTQLTS